MRLEFAQGQTLTLSCDLKQKSLYLIVSGKKEEPDMLQLPPTKPVCGKDEEPKLKDLKTDWATGREIADYFGCSRSQV